MLALDPRVIIAAIEQDMGEGIRREVRLRIQQCNIPSRWTGHLALRWRVDVFHEERISNLKHFKRKSRQSVRCVVADVWRR